MTTAQCVTETNSQVEIQEQLVQRHLSSGTETSTESLELLPHISPTSFLLLDEQCLIMALHLLGRTWRHTELKDPERQKLTECGRFEVLDTDSEEFFFHNWIPLLVAQ